MQLCSSLLAYGHTYKMVNEVMHQNWIKFCSDQVHVQRILYGFEAN